MVKVFRFNALDGYALCQPVRPSDFEVFSQLIDGTPRQSSWSRLKVGLVREEAGVRLEESDAPWLGGHALIFTERAVSALGGLLRESGELLPLLCDDADLWVYNPTEVIDALDEGASGVVRFKDQRIMSVQRYVFREDAVRGQKIFKIKRLRVSPSFVGEAFVGAWHRAGLRGLGFELVWEAG
jgi:hypothetical protein